LTIICDEEAKEKQIKSKEERKAELQSNVE